MNLKKIIGLAVVIVFIGLQFFVKKDNVSSYESVAVFEKEVQLPENVKKVFKQNCYHCHSNHTVYPWYASIGAVNVVLNHHIEEGKEHLNFSDWSSYPQNRQLHKLAEVYEEVEEGEMPLKLYRLIHGDLSEEDKNSILNWSKTYKE